MIEAPAKVVELELEAGCDRDLDGLVGYRSAWILVRLHGVPIGRLEIGLTPRATRLPANVVRRRIAAELGPAIVEHLVTDALLVDPEALADPDSLARISHPAPAGSPPSITVAVCTRDRPQLLGRCLDALLDGAACGAEILVVDNAPSDSRAREVVREREPRVRYVCEPRVGLNHARNRAWYEARGDIVAYIDDDAVAAPGWAPAVCATFAEEPHAACITGLVEPLSLDSPAQVLFERYGGFGRGYRKRWFRFREQARRTTPAWVKGAGAFGTGANMAFRRSVLAELGGFDPALDVGTPTAGGGDLDLFYRVLKHGHTLIYDPAVLVRHEHRRSREELRRQLANHGHGLYSYFARNARAYPEERLGFVQFGAWWFAYWSLRRWLGAVLGRETFPRDLIEAELLGSLRGLRLYGRSLEAVRNAAQDHDPMAAATSLHRRQTRAPAARRAAFPFATAVERIDIDRPVSGFDASIDHNLLRAYLFWRGAPLADVTVEDADIGISARRLGATIACAHGSTLLDAARRSREHDETHATVAPGRDVVRALLGFECAQGSSPRPAGARSTEQAKNAGDTYTSEPARQTPFVSVVIATRERPDDLARCLAALARQAFDAAWEIIVVDNAPESDRTREVARSHDRVRYVVEPRRGSPYARNTGVAAARAPIVAMIDDDAEADGHWLATLIEPFERPDVAIVTGLTLPAALSTPAELAFEQYGGLSRGYRPFEVDGRWFHSCRRAVPTWILGATVNAAFRRAIFEDPAIGGFSPLLGAGVATGVGEDTFLFYEALRAGWTLAYEPRAVVWHRHRESLGEFRRQLYAYSRGHVAYQLLTWQTYGDLRAWRRLFLELPAAHAARAAARIAGRTSHTLLHLMVEIAGNLAGPFALRRARREAARTNHRAPSAVPAPPDVTTYARPTRRTPPAERTEESVAHRAAEPARDGARGRRPNGG